jgi:hypothetical protein
VIAAHGIVQRLLLLVEIAVVIKEPAIRSNVVKVLI